MEWKEFDSLEASASSISAKIKQMFLNWILIHIMGDVIKNGREELCGIEMEKNRKENTFAFHVNISIFNMIHL